MENMLYIVIDVEGDGMWLEIQATHTTSGRTGKRADLTTSRVTKCSGPSRPRDKRARGRREKARDLATRREIPSQIHREQ